MACLWKRGKTYYERYYLGGKQKAVCLHTPSYRIAKEKLCELESGLVGNLEIPLPTRTPIARVVSAQSATSEKCVSSQFLGGLSWRSMIEAGIMSSE